MTWFAVMSKVRKEWLAQRNLIAQGYRTFWPHISEWTTPRRTKPRLVLKAYMPRYLFVAPNGSGHSVYQINNTIGVATVVYAGGGVLSVPEPIMQELMARADETGEVVVGKKAPNPFPGNPGDLVKLAETSAFAGLICELKEVGVGDGLLVEMEQMLGSRRMIAIKQGDVGQVIRQDGAVVEIENGQV